MKLITLLPIAAFTAAFVIPDESMTQQLIIEKENDAGSVFDQLPSIEDVYSSAKEVFDTTIEAGENAFDNAISAATDAAGKAKSSFHCHKSQLAQDTKEWFDNALPTAEDLDFDIFSVAEHPHHPPKHGRPGHGHRGGHGGHGHRKPTKSVYELINESKYTTKLAKLINKYDNLVEVLNGTSSNFTIFAPTDEAFDKIPHHKDYPSDAVYQFLLYHVVKDFYPAPKILAYHTLPSMREEAHLGGEPQRLRVGLSLRGLTVNLRSKVVAANIFGTNGVIHGIDNVIIPPPSAATIIEYLPGEFSTLQLGLEKTGLFDALKSAPHAGGTLFAPSNWAFKKLGPRVNGFLFSKYGEKYLKALLEYHVVANQTLYSDAYYNHASSVDSEGSHKGPTKGYFHVDLPTLLKGRSLSIDVARYGGFISIKINGFSRVTFQDGVARDGVIQEVGSVLIPPKTPGQHAEVADEELTVEELKERLSGYVSEL